MEPYDSLGQKENLPPFFKSLMVLVKLLKLRIQFLVLGVTRTFLAQFSVAKGIGHDSASRSNCTFQSRKTLIASIQQWYLNSKPSQWIYPIDSYDPPKCHFYVQEDITFMLQNG